MTSYILLEPPDPALIIAHIKDRYQEKDLIEISAMLAELNQQARNRSFSTEDWLYLGMQFKAKYQKMLSGEDIPGYKENVTFWGHIVEVLSSTPANVLSGTMNAIQKWAFEENWQVVESEKNARAALIQAKEREWQLSTLDYTLKDAADLAKTFPEYAKFLDAQVPIGQGQSWSDTSPAQVIKKQPQLNLPPAIKNGCQPDGSVLIKLDDLKDWLSVNFADFEVNYLYPILQNTYEINNKIDSLQKTVNSIGDKQDAFIVWTLEKDEAYQKSLLEEARLKREQFITDKGFKAFSSTIMILATAIGSANQEAGREIVAVGKAGISIAQGIMEYGASAAALCATLGPVGWAVGGVILIGNVVSAITNLVADLNGQPSADTVIINQISQLRDLVKDLGTKMQSRFDRIDQNLWAIQKKAEEILGKIAQVEVKIDQMNEEFNELFGKIAGLSNQLNSLFVIEHLTEFREKRSAVLGYYDKKMVLPYQGPDESYHSFENQCLNLATDYAFSDAASPSLESLDILCLKDQLQSNQYPLVSKLTIISQWLDFISNYSKEHKYASFKNPLSDDGNQVVANPYVWAMGASSLANMNMQWPFHAHNCPDEGAYSSQLRRQIVKVGEDIRAKLRRITLIGDPPKGNKEFFIGLRQFYDDNLVNLRREIVGKENEYLSTNKIPLCLDLWDLEHFRNCLDVDYNMDMTHRLYQELEIEVENSPDFFMCSLEADSADTYKIPVPENLIRMLTPLHVAIFKLSKMMGYKSTLSSKYRLEYIPKPELGWNIFNLRVYISVWLNRPSFDPYFLCEIRIDSDAKYKEIPTVPDVSLPIQPPPTYLKDDQRALAGYLITDPVQVFDIVDGTIVIDNNPARKWTGDNGLKARVEEILWGNLENNPAITHIEDYIRLDFSNVIEYSEIIRKNLCSHLSNKLLTTSFTFARVLDGVKALTASVIDLGMPSAVINDELLRGLLWGKDSIPDSSLIAAFYQSPDSYKYKEHPLELIKAAADRRNDALKTAIDTYLDLYERDQFSDTPEVIDNTLALCKSTEAKIKTAWEVDIISQLPRLNRQSAPSSDVKRVHALIRAWNSSFNDTNLPMTDTFSQATENAVIDFQRSKGILADGVVDAYTWAALLGVGSFRDKHPEKLRVVLGTSNGNYVCCNGVSAVGKLDEPNSIFQLTINSFFDVGMKPVPSPTPTVASRAIPSGVNVPIHPPSTTIPFNSGEITFINKPCTGIDVSLKSLANNRYLCAEGNGGRELTINREKSEDPGTFFRMYPSNLDGYTIPSHWGTFFLYTVDGSPVSINGTEISAFPPDSQSIKKLTIVQAHGPVVSKGSMDIPISKDCQVNIGADNKYMSGPVLYAKALSLDSGSILNIESIDHQPLRYLSKVAIQTDDGRFLSLDENTFGIVFNRSPTDAQKTFTLRSDPEQMEDGTEIYLQASNELYVGLSGRAGLAANRSLITEAERFKVTIHP